jgi:hypothetical protein
MYALVTFLVRASQEHSVTELQLITGFSVLFPLLLLGVGWRAQDRGRREAWAAVVDECPLCDLALSCQGGGTQCLRCGFDSARQRSAEEERLLTLASELKTASQSVDLAWRHIQIAAELMYARKGPRHAEYKESWELFQSAYLDALDALTHVAAALPELVPEALEPGVGWQDPRAALPEVEALRCGVRDARRALRSMLGKGAQA